MDASDAWRDVQRNLGALFTCSTVGEYRQIETPFLYPDGDVIEVYCKVEGDGVTVTDLAETTGWLRTQSVAPRRTTRQNEVIEDVCVTLDLEFHRGALQAPCRAGDDLADVIMRVAQGALRVSDLWFTMRTQAAPSIGNEVERLLAARELCFERGGRRRGLSGRDWRVDFEVTTERRRSLVEVLSAANRAAARRVSQRVLAAWHDLSGLATGPEALTFVSLFDDAADVWKEQDFRLLEPLSTVARWSRPDEFVGVLRHAGVAAADTTRRGASAGEHRVAAGR